jgi:hypothetical protein
MLILNVNGALNLGRLLDNVIEDQIECEDMHILTEPSKNDDCFDSASS